MELALIRPVKLPADSEIEAFGQSADFEIIVFVDCLMPARLRGVAPVQFVERIPPLETCYDSRVVPVVSIVAGNAKVRIVPAVQGVYSTQDNQRIILAD